MTLRAFVRDSRKIRMKESNEKYRNLKKLTCKGTLRQVFYLSEAPSPPMTEEGAGGGGGCLR